MDQEEISLETLKSAVKDKGAKWTPEETTLTLLSIEEKAQRLGLLPTEMETSLATELGLDKPLTSKSSAKKTSKTSNPGSAGLPSKIDWRNVSGVNWTTSMKDQGSWRGRNINEDQVAGIAKVVMEADRLDVWWSNNTINFVRCWKKY